MRKEPLTQTTDTNSRRGTAARVLFTLALAACIVFIFSNSMQIGSVSSGISGRALAEIKRLLRAAGFDGMADRITEHILRKLGHYCEYTLEGFLLMLCTRVYTRRYVRHLSWPMLGGLLTGLADETIQLFTPGRSSQVTDVWIDFSGVLTGIVIGLILLAIINAAARRRRAASRQ